MTALDAPYDLACFAPDYARARERFVDLARRQAATDARYYANPNLGPAGEALGTDVQWFGPADADRVLVTISATHGVEGFSGSGAQCDWLAGARPGWLPAGVAALFIHAINPHGFAWLRRVTEEGVDLNRNFIDFDQPAPENPGYDALAEDLVPPELSGPRFEAAEARIAIYRETHGEVAFQVARCGGQYRHPGGMFHGGTAPTWSRRTVESILADFRLAGRRQVAVIDFHTGLGPYGYGEPICAHALDAPAVDRARAWYGPSLTEPNRGTSSSVPKVGTSELGWERSLGDAVTYVALEFGTFAPEAGRRALREDHWLHLHAAPDGAIDWNGAETRRIKARIKRHYFPATPDWLQMVLFRSRQVIAQGLAGLAAV